MLIERVREREVQARIRISDAEVDALIDKQRSLAVGKTEYDIAQILVTVPERAGDAEVAERRARADAALARVRAGEPFEAVAKAVSEDANRAQGGAIGLRPADRLPDVFVGAVQVLKPGQVIDAPLRSGAGFHVLKLLERKDGQAMSVTQTRASHILLRVSAQLNQTTAVARLGEFKQQIKSGAATFESLARANSEDPSAPQGGDLGWTSPGAFVPEFEQAMDALPVGGLSEPVISRFGVHLIRVNERRHLALDLKQQREQARNLLREQKFEEAYNEWSRDLRARAYVELREPPP
jgi:peptidyl-prolyl cis-trans isomerase SurA